MKISALKTEFEDATFDTVLLYGVIPAPILPLDVVGPEMYRVLKPGGRLAVWTAFPWSPESLTRHARFSYTGKKDGVFTFVKQ